MENAKRFLLPIMVVTLLVIQLMSPFTVFADGETPPETTGEVDNPEETQEETEEPVTPEETDVPDETQPAEGEQTTASEQETTEAEVPQASESNPEESSTQENETADEVPAEGEAPAGGEDLTVAEALELAPEGTEIVVINEEGQVEPLATEEAAQIVEIVDPIWCPGTQEPTPNANGCTDSHTTVTDLITELLSDTTKFKDAGTVYFTSTYSAPDATFDGATLTALTDLTIQGGWNGLASGAGYALSGVTTFSGQYLHIVNWDGKVTLYDIVVDSSGDTGIKVETSGDINLENVKSINNDRDGARLANCKFNLAKGFCEGTGNITLNGTNEFNMNEGNFGLVAYSAGDITLNNITANNNKIGTGVSLDNRGGTGKITLTGTNVFNLNRNNGLAAYSKGDITVNNITANDNNNNDNSGAILINTGGTGKITVTDGDFNRNSKYGIWAFAGGDLTLNNVTASRNSDINVYVISGSDITFSGVTTYGSRLGVSANQSSGNQTISCSEIFNNNIGINAFLGDVSNTLTLISVTFSNNTLGDLNQTGGTLVENTDYDCNPSGGGKKVVIYPSLPVNQVSASSGITELNCSDYKGTQFTVPDGNFVYFPCPISDNASVSALEPENPPEGATVHSAFTTTVTKNGTAVSTLPTFATLSFLIPASVDPASLAILYWNGTEWVEQSGFLSADGLYFQATVNFSGDFLLVSK